MNKALCILAFLLIGALAETSIPEEKKEKPSVLPFSVIPYHAIAMFVVWTFLVELPLIAIQNFRAPTVHLALFALLDITTLGSVGFAAFQKWDKISNWSFKSPQAIAHCVLGLLVPSLILLQHFLGFLTLNKSATAKGPHKKLGGFLYILTKFSVLTGAYMYDQTLFYVALGWFVVVLLARLIFGGGKPAESKKTKSK